MRGPLNSAFWSTRLEGYTHQWPASHNSCHKAFEFESGLNCYSEVRHEVRFSRSDWDQEISNIEDISKWSLNSYIMIAEHAWGIKTDGTCLMSVSCKTLQMHSRHIPPILIVFNPVWLADWLAGCHTLYLHTFATLVSIPNKESDRNNGVLNSLILTHIRTWVLTGLQNTFAYEQAQSVALHCGYRQVCNWRHATYSWHLRESCN